MIVSRFVEASSIILEKDEGDAWTISLFARAVVRYRRKSGLLCERLRPDYVEEFRAATKAAARKRMYTWLREHKVRMVWDRADELFFSGKRDAA